MLKWNWSWVKFSYLLSQENEATFEEKQKQIEAMKGSSSKQEISQVKKEVEKSYNEMLHGIKEKVWFNFSFIDVYMNILIITCCLWLDL